MSMVKLLPIAAFGMLLAAPGQAAAEDGYVFCLAAKSDRTQAWLSRIFLSTSPARSHKEAWIAHVQQLGLVGSNYIDAATGCQGLYSSPTDAEAAIQRGIRSFGEGYTFTRLDWAPGTNVPEQPLAEVVHDPQGQSASLAIDRRNGTRYGWAIDYPDWVQSDRRALEECERDGSNCQIVLRFTGGCGVYVADQAKGSTVYGWGTARDRGGAEANARREASERGGTQLLTRVWGCNSPARQTTSASDLRAEQETRAAEAAEAAEKARIEELNRRAAERTAAMEAENAARQAKYDQERQAYERRLREIEAAQRRFEEESRRHAEEVARAKAAEEQYQRQMREYEDQFGPGKVRPPG